MCKRLLLTCGVLCVGIWGARAEDMVRAAEVRSIGSGATLTAIERGYFNDQGIKVELDAIDSAANAIAARAEPLPDHRGASGRLFQRARQGSPIMRWRTAPRRRSATT